MTGTVKTELVINKLLIFRCSFPGIAVLSKVLDFK